MDQGTAQDKRYLRNVSTNMAVRAIDCMKITLNKRMFD